MRNRINVGLLMLAYPSRVTALHCRSPSRLAHRALKMDGDKPVEAAIRSKLNEKLSPVHLDVINESFMHNVPKDYESHFKVVVVSDIFNDLPLLKRHRLVNEILDEELKTSIHALSIVAKTPAQWDESSKTIEPSPPCKGGFGK
ncbi:bolA-like protein DDB_G0274169 [Lycorma delicatula]|uniref:bolA-like protein DDB_G0274169 n=1 Tax=Lycorma delicatula TaxID=130591 RepID=UPI003F513B93